MQGVDRAALAGIAVEELESQALILDDGFQHRRLGRDLDVVLIDALDPFGGGRLFPRGLLREPVRSLRRAGLVVLSRADLIDGAERKSIQGRAEASTGRRTRWLEARHAPLDVLDANGRSYPLASTLGVRVAAFCGIGNPEGFRKTLEGLGVTVVGFRAFPDHHPYHAQDLADLAGRAAGLGAELALTTQKDLVKLRTQDLGPLPLRALRIGLDFLEGAALLDEALTPLLPA